MGTPQEVLKLVERFDSNRESYMAGEYKEAQIRIEFIDPFFEQLGWDMGNRNGYAEAYKDVISITAYIFTVLFPRTRVRH